MDENDEIGRSQRGDTGDLTPPKNQKSMGVEGKRHGVGWEDSKCRACYGMTLKFANFLNFYAMNRWKNVEISPKMARDRQFIFEYPFRVPTDIIARAGGGRFASQRAR